MGGQMGEQMKAYEEELQKIMTPEQYKAYKADQEERMKQGRPQGPRPQRN
jgi:Spy/CpxP family protein refolding chaperone